MSVTQVNKHIGFNPPNAIGANMHQVSILSEKYGSERANLWGPGFEYNNIYFI